jgi:hypothetical protein
VGGIEALALIASAFHPKGAFCGAMQTLNGNLGKLGYFIVGFFALSWIVSILSYKWQRLDESKYASVLPLALRAAPASDRKSAAGAPLPGVVIPPNRRYDDFRPAFIQIGPCKFGACPRAKPLFVLAWTATPVSRGVWKLDC